MWSNNQDSPSISRQNTSFFFFLSFWMMWNPLKIGPFGPTLVNHKYTTPPTKTVYQVIPEKLRET